MKNLITFTNILGAVAVLALIAACETTSTNANANVMAHKEMMLAQSGFRTKTVTTAKQQQQVAQLAVGRVSMVTYQGKTYYVFPTATRNQVYVGNKSMYQAYKNRMIHAARQVQAQQAQQPQQMTKAQQAQQALAPIPIQLDPDPEGVSVQEFDGFGPMSVISE